MNNGMRELTEEDLENVRAGAPIEEVFRPVDESELGLDELDSVLGGVSVEKGMESLEESGILRDSRREKLLEAKEELEQIKAQSLENQETTTTGKGLR